LAAARLAPLGGVTCAVLGAPEKARTKTRREPAAMRETLYDIPVRRLDGAPATLRDYAGHVLLVVNVASKCGLTPQYESLQRAFERERERGLVVLGFPSNQFGKQEPGTSGEIATFCEENYSVTFPLFEKIDVNGDERHPLYRELIAAQPEAISAGDTFREKLARYGIKQAQPSDVFWNFEKFLVSRDGRVVGRFAPDISVDDPLLRAAIDTELGSPNP
jgi:glutathione peroxidase